MTTHSELFDVIELLVNLPKQNQSIGAQGTVVECYEDSTFEMEFANETSKILAWCMLFSQQFIVVWQSVTKQWLPAAKKVTSILKQLPECKQKEILNYARLFRSGLGRVTN